MNTYAVKPYKQCNTVKTTDGYMASMTSVKKIFAPTPVEFTAVAAVVLLASIAVKFWMNLFNRGLAKRIDSTALMATAADSRNDCIATFAVLIAAVVEKVPHILPLEDVQHRLARGALGLPVVGVANDVPLL